MDTGTSVKVAVRIRPLGPEEAFDDAQHCINTVPGVAQIIAGTDAYFTFDHVFGVDSTQSAIYDDCVAELLNAAFEGFNATILAYGQTGSGKTWTMGSGSSDMRLGGDSFGIIPRVIKSLFDLIAQKEEDDPNSSYKVHIQFLELYGEDIKDLLEHTKLSKVSIRETSTGDVFVSGAREETVSSASQMMRALEDGSRHRTTSSTLMNSSSSRSHAIFTVFLEHTIETTTTTRSGTPVDTDDVSVAESRFEDDGESVSLSNFDRSVTQSKEVRKCKFHFVDLAGSERAKRTGAQGVQMKEGIDINKGLLALGNVISALGDESRRGKVHVPYRVSKLTRMLQDSLGGNSKTLMICCVSPSESNFHESLNALRYANRARNIKNKPRVNRDPTLVLVAEMKLLVTSLATELIDARKSGGPMPDSATPIADLEAILRNNGEIKPRPSHVSHIRPPSLKFSGLSLRCDDEPSQLSGRLSGRLSARTSFTISNPPSALPTPSKDHIAAAAFTRREHAREVTALKGRASEYEAEITRLKDKLRSAKSKISEREETVILMESERDYFRMKWSDACPEEALSLSEMSAVGCLFDAISEPVEMATDMVEREMTHVTQLSAGYLREIQVLKREIAEQRQVITQSSAAACDIADSVLESDLSTNVARVIAETERHLKLEAKRLRTLSGNSNSDVTMSSVLSSLDDGNDSDNSADITEPTDVENSNRRNRGAESKIEEKDLNYQRRQKVMVEEVAELGESIDLKEQLLGQLKRSRYQYGIMKAFYEKKLNDLNSEMDRKQHERERLLEELTDLEKVARASKEEEDSSKGQSKQKVLRDKLEKKDDELRSMKARQEELSNLSRVQARYITQVSKLENDIITMRKQKVELSKSLQLEKKKHFTLLNEKAKQIDKLKRELVKSTMEAKRLGNDKCVAEERAKEAIKTAAGLRKKATELPRFQHMSDASKGKARTLGSRQSTIDVRILSESELKTKKWLDGKISDINVMEESVATLRRQLEQQMSLLKSKETLEHERHAINALRHVEGHHGGLTLEDEEALQEVEDRLESVEGQLKLRDRNINEIEGKIGVDGDVGLMQGKALEALKKMSATSQPASHDLIGLLFSMLVSSKLSSRQKKTDMQRIEVKEKQLRLELDEVVKRMHVLVRAHDIELTRSANEYEEKLLGLFTHSTIGQIVTKESGLAQCGSDDIAHGIPSIASAGSEDSPFILSGPGSFSTQGPGSFSTQGFPSSPGSFAMKRFSFGQSHGSMANDATHTVLLAAATEQCGLLKGRLEREARRNKDLHIRITELTHRLMLSKEELKERDVNVKFLEDESNLFRDIANRLRAGVLTLGGTASGVILDQVKGGRKFNGKSGARAVQDLDERRSKWDSDDDEEEDIEEDDTLKGEFMHLADVITRTGSLIDKSRSGESGKESEPTSPLSSPRNMSTRHPSSGSIGSGREVVYDRLTNPSNYTGAMKSAFGSDLVRKRQLVQLIKNGAPYNISGYAPPRVEPTTRTGTQSRKSLPASGRLTPRDSQPDRLQGAAVSLTGEDSPNSSISDSLSSSSDPKRTAPSTSPKIRRPVSMPFTKNTKQGSGTASTSLIADDGGRANAYVSNFQKPPAERTLSKSLPTHDDIEYAVNRLTETGKERGRGPEIHQSHLQPRSTSKSMGGSRHSITGDIVISPVSGDECEGVPDVDISRKQRGMSLPDGILDPHAVNMVESEDNRTSRESQSPSPRLDSNSKVHIKVEKDSLVSVKKGFLADASVTVSMASGKTVSSPLRSPSMLV